jgi:pyruvate/2-oxoglutarate dehydrogenase complex dihydrolipoamide acyltransferase (E2) component
MIGMVKIPSQMPELPMPVLKAIFKNVGDKVGIGDVLFSYESDGAVFEETSAIMGTVIASLFKPGDKVSEGTPVLVVNGC